MRACPTCGAKYTVRISYCFSDGSVLQDQQVGSTGDSSSFAAPLPDTTVAKKRRRRTLVGASGPTAFSQGAAPRLEAAPEDEEEAPLKSDVEPRVLTLLPMQAVTRRKPKPKPKPAPAPEPAPAPAPAPQPAPAPAPQPAAQQPPPAEAPPPVDYDDEPAAASKGPPMVVLGLAGAGLLGMMAVGALVIFGSTMMLGDSDESTKGPSQAEVAGSTPTLPEPPPRPPVVPTPEVEPDTEPAIPVDPGSEQLPEDVEPGTETPAVDVGSAAVAPVVPVVPDPVVAPPQPVEDVWGTAAPPAPTLAKLTIRSTPSGAKLVVDGKVVGTAPHTVELPHGAHRVELSLDGYVAQSKAVDLSGDLALPIQLVAKAAPVVNTPATPPAPPAPPAPEAREGAVMIFMTGSKGEMVSVDGKSIGKLPARTTLTEGAHTFVVEGESGRFEIRRSVTFNAAGSAVVNLAAP